MKAQMVPGTVFLSAQNVGWASELGGARGFLKCVVKMVPGTVFFGASNRAIMRVEVSGGAGGSPTS